MTVRKALVTIEDLYRLPSGSCRYELLDGELIEMAPSNYRHDRIRALMAHFLLAFVLPRDLGDVLSGDTGIILGRNPDRVRAPDCCFFAKDRLPPGEAPQTFSELVPDLVVEVVSPGDTRREVREKTDEWLRAGARLVWTLDSEARTVVVNDAPGTGRILREGDTLTGDPVLPGFTLPIAKLFA